MTAPVAQTPAERLWQERRPLVIGHRGFPAAAPENTLPSFQLALTARADLTELDYHHTRDGELVVIHDFTLDRTTSATNVWPGKDLKVADYTFDQLRTLEAGAWFAPGFAGTRLLRLETALDAIQQGSVTLIERKAGDAQACVELLRRKSLVNHVVVQSFDWNYLADFHRLEPAQILGGLGPWGSFKGEKLSDDDKWLSPRWVDEARQIGLKAVVWNKQVRREAIAYAHTRGLKVWVYTINDPTVANELLDLGVDGLISDNPAQTWRTLALRPGK
jgi:glycerophosphoryl diester phosphodiesterase